MPPSDPRTCHNCGETLLGPYCWSCGQEDVDLHRPLRQLAQDAVGDLLNLDTRLLRTFVPLFFRPGDLTREYLAGRRVRFVPPLKTFLLASLIFFSLVALLPKTRVTVNQDSKTLPKIPGGGTTINFNLPDREERTWLDRRLNAARHRASENPEAFLGSILNNLPRAFFLLLPAVALLLKLLYWKQSRYYLDHLIFVLHHHAFAFVVLTLLLLLGRPWVPDWLSTLLVPLLWIWLFLYSALALHRVYGGSRWKTFFRFSSLLAAYSVVFVATLLLMVFLTLFWF